MRTLGKVAAKVAAIVGLLVLVLWVFVSTTWPSYTFRYRLICDVEVDGQSHTGSSVFEVTWQTEPAMSASRWSIQVEGDAVVVDLGNHGALLIPNSWVQTKEPSGAMMPYVAFWAFKDQLPSFSRGTFTQSALKALLRVRGKTKLAADDLPQFVWLKNINDPNSAQIITPNQFPQVIGGNARLVSLSVETTDEKPTQHSLSSRLPWFDAMLKKERLERQKTRVMHGRSQPYRLMAADLVGWQHTQ